MSQALEDIAAERRRQMEIWAPEHDDKHEYGELAQAAAAYACHTDHREQADVFITKVGGGQTRCGWFLPHHLLWPWSRDHWRPGSSRRNLIKAGALIVAEIERLDRVAAKATPNPVS